MPPLDRKYPGFGLTTITRAMIAAFVLLLAQGPAQAQNLLRRSDPWLIMPAAVLQGLDKITARVSKVTIGVDDIGAYGTLRITVRACRKRPPTEPPESAAFLEISDQKPGEPPVALFSGWMFASSPALNALEHPVYDVWVLDCSNASSTAPPSGKE
jgi:hypothetical protein